MIKLYRVFRKVFFPKCCLTDPLPTSAKRVTQSFARVRQFQPYGNNLVLQVAEPVCPDERSGRANYLSEQYLGMSPT